MSGFSRKLATLRLSAADCDFAIPRPRQSWEARVCEWSDLWDLRRSGWFLCRGVLSGPTPHPRKETSGSSKLADNKMHGGWGLFS